MEALDKISDYKLNSNVEFHMQDSIESYITYLNMLSELSPRECEIFLNTLKNNEIINNQEMEHEDPFMVQLELELECSKGKKNTSIDIMTNSILENKPLTIRKIEQLHRLIIHGTCDDKPENYKIRDKQAYVSETTNGIEKVCYYAPNPEEIKPYLNKILEFLNSDDNKKEQDILYNSILTHFYIAALQPFGNGNTRLARLIEYGSIFKLSREVLGSKIKSPALFVSKNYLMTRASYRNNISKLVNEPTDDSFNNWMNYNLNMVDEQIYFCNNILKKRFK